ncbi:CvpA family protein [Patescibacteria group bacterium]|nr:CvpA family protein [Patescibacteria group bacterium]MBU0777439.1 CvpA family protein [Patescibacteria group bacterium]MBU0846074.1 CvpA family protein [Patescibacteria group bacterium]MBU0923127.1 CvpA family protein [Patescibacteria group bacterium]MBU1066842.1 CvpA family protein [Patescibacteria group bacterium]
MNILSLNGNWVDLLIIAIILFFVTEGVRHGFWVILADFFSFLGSILISFRAYQFTAGLLRANFSLSPSASNALGFLITAILTEALLGYLFGHAITKLPKKYRKIKGQKILAILPALGEGLIIVAFILTLVLGLPVSPKIKLSTTESKIGGYILEQTAGIESKINEIFGGVIEDSLTYFTIKPESKERVALEVATQELLVDEASEGEMFKLVNEEREAAGLNKLSWDTEIVSVARVHATDMWERKYFGHVSPEGKDAGDRLTEAGINYDYAGENLALAPTVSSAHVGLMNSEGHRENILEPKFNKVGIGVIDNGIYGKMFVQVFTD